MSKIGDTIGPSETERNIQYVVDHFRNIRALDLEKYRIKNEYKIKSGTDEKSKFSVSDEKWADYIVYYNSIKILIVEAKSKHDFQRAIEQFRSTIKIIENYYDNKSSELKKIITMLSLIYANDNIFYDEFHVDLKKKIIHNRKNKGKPLIIEGKMVFAFKVSG